MKINTFHKKYKKITPANGFMTEKSEHRQRYGRVMTPYIVCADGFTMSVQASGSHYCEPRGNYNRYREFEIGFPSQKESLIMRYCEDESKPTDTVYAFVPFNVVNDVLEKHGGIDIDATLKRAEEMQKSA